MIVLSKRKSTKNTFGCCIFRGKLRFYKRFENPNLFKGEIEGYSNVEGILNIPKRVHIDEKNMIIYYEYIRNINKKTMHHRLYRKYFDIPLLFLEKGYNDIEKINENECRNKTFFRERTKFIDEYLDKLDILNNNIVINRKSVDTKKFLLDIKEKLNEEKDVYAVISQGDPTDLNLLNDGSVIDFELGGRNSLVGEIAIFLNCIMINSYYLYVKYTSPIDKSFLKDYEKNKHNIKYQIQKCDNTINIDLELDIPSENRQVLCRFFDFLTKKYEKNVIFSINEYLKYYLAFRMLTPKNLISMTEDDTILSLSLAYLMFENSQELSELEEKIRSNLKLK